MFLSRILCPDGRIALALRQGSEAALVRGDAALAPLVAQAQQGGIPLAQAILARGLADPLDIASLLAQGRVLAPLPDGPVTLLPASPGDEALPLSLAAPGAGLGLMDAPGTLEGGAAAVFLADASGRPDLIGWVQTHLAKVGGAQGWRRLSCGPELFLDPGPVTTIGHVQLMANGRALAEFAIPGSGRPAAVPHMPLMPPGTVAVQRRTRWLLRPPQGQPATTLNSRIAGLGLALWNAIDEDAALSAKPDQDSTRRRQA